MLELQTLRLPLSLLARQYLFFILRIKLPRKEGGLGKMKIPLLADTNHNISRDYGVLLESAGYAYR